MIFNVALFLFAFSMAIGGVYYNNLYCMFISGFNFASLYYHISNRKTHKETMKILNDMLEYLRDHNKRMKR